MSKPKNLDISPIGRMITLLLTLTFNNVAGQTLTGTETVNNYSIAQKRLLAITIFQCADFQTQNNQDQDSIMAIACKITGMPFLLPFNETFPANRNAQTTELLNTGRLKEAKQKLDKKSGEIRIQGLLEIFLWYLHQEGNHTNDLDSAARFLQIASVESNNTESVRWKDVCLFQSAELAYQRGDTQQSRKLFSGVAKSGLQQSNAQLTAFAYVRIGDLLSPTDTAKESYYYQALKIFQSLPLVEKQIEILWKIALCHEHKDFLQAEKDLREIIRLSAQIGFKHIFYAQSHLSYILGNNGDYLGTMDYAKAALENMKWSGFLAMQGMCYMRMATAYAILGKLDESLNWLKMAINTGTIENHLFWYNSVLSLPGVMGLQMNKPAMAISLIDSITRISPPITVWEKLELLSDVGICYGFLNKPVLADKYFKEFFSLANANPKADPYGNLFAEYIMIVHYYISRQQISMARKILQRAMVNERKIAEGMAYKYSIYYKLDSIEGNYKSALENHIKYKMYYDSSISISQRLKMDQLTVQYAAEAKDKDIRLLRQQGIVQQSEIKQNRIARNILVLGTSFLIIIVGLLFNRYRLKQRANRAINKQNIELQRLVDEKEWLLKEVHHRVKNNLHTIISLLESQADYLENDALKAIQNSQHRIYAMSLIHQKLYQTDDIKVIDMTLFLPEFIRYLKDSFNFDVHSNIQFRLDIQPISLGVSQAIPVALIINEALTNSIKYAFPNNSNGVISISMHKDADQITLVIADSGIGMNETLLNLPSESLGIRLIKGLSGDINADLRLENDNGTKITLVFNFDNFPGNNVLSEVNINEPEYI